MLRHAWNMINAIAFVSKVGTYITKQIIFSFKTIRRYASEIGFSRKWNVDRTWNNFLYKFLSVFCLKRIELYSPYRQRSVIKVCKTVSVCSFGLNSVPSEPLIRLHSEISPSDVFNQALTVVAPFQLNNSPNLDRSSTPVLISCKPSCVSFFLFVKIV